MHQQSVAHVFTICGICGVFAITLTWILQNYLQLLLQTVVWIIAIHFCMVSPTLTSWGFSVQIWLAHLVTMSPSFTCNVPLLRSLYWLPVRFRILFKIYLLTYKTLREKQPVYLHSMLSPWLPSRPLRFNTGISLFLLFPGYPDSYFAFPVLGFRLCQVDIKFLHSMFLFLDTCLWFSEKHFQKMISREDLNHFRHQLTYLPLKQEPLPCSCYLNPSQGSQLHHHFSFICFTYPWFTTVCTWWGPNPFHGDWPQVWFRQDSARDVLHILLSWLLSHWPCLLALLPHPPFQSACT